jgi:hypothetical protein
VEYPTDHWLSSYLLTPWSRVLLEKLTVLQLVKKFLAFYGTRRFIIAFTSGRHLFLSRASSIQSIPPHSNSWRSILILFFPLRQGPPQRENKELGDQSKKINFFLAPKLPWGWRHFVSLRNTSQNAKIIQVYSSSIMKIISRYRSRKRCHFTKTLPRAAVCKYMCVYRRFIDSL